MPTTRTRARRTRHPGRAVSLFETLKRKYGGTLRDVIAFGAQPRSGWARSSRAGGTRAARPGDRSGEEIARRLGTKLGAQRKKAAPKLAAGVTGICGTSAFAKSDFA
jgi:DNA repair protein RecN (Recombination protein N)